MPRYRTAYPPEFRRQMVDLVRCGRTPEELARGVRNFATDVKATLAGPVALNEKGKAKRVSTQEARRRSARTRP
jgi:hypothetical protein